MFVKYNCNYNKFNDINMQRILILTVHLQYFLQNKLAGNSGAYVTIDCITAMKKDMKLPQGICCSLF